MRVLLISVSMLSCSAAHLRALKDDGDAGHQETFVVDGHREVLSVPSFGFDEHSGSAAMVIHGKSAQGHSAAKQPVANDYFSDKSRRELRSAMSALVKAEIPKVEHYLKRRADDLGLHHSKLASKRNAGLAVRRAFRAAQRITASKAITYCKSLSKLSSMPPLCEEESRAMLNTLQRETLARWVGSAYDASVPIASAEASKSAFNATQAATIHDINVATNKISKRIFQVEYPNAQAKWAEIYAHEMKVLDQKKVEFFQKFTRELIPKVKISITNAMWDKPIKDANARMEVSAKKQAEITSARVSAETLAPKYVAAARAAMPLAIRTAHQKAMNQWVPGWAPDRPSVSGFKSDLVG
mmetsp:Transcript_59091/g.129445  ORF Transcript_59091/g.129445 Transcript_59091/m.129445 type:complete len:355 (+) Transcript_59091:111-1175(+)